MSAEAPRFLSAGSTHQGFVRANNEDRFYCDEERGFFMVIDGMGGHAAGEEAAQIALDRIKGRLERQTGLLDQRIREAIALANNAIYQASRTKEEWQGMACVLTVAAIEDGHAVIGHVGDSRLYKIQRGKIEKITHDHSPVGEREDTGELTEDDAMQHPRRNEVYRDVGSEEHTPDDEDFIEVSKIAFEADSALLLCSDGLSDVVASKSILQIVQEYAGDRWATVRKLIEAANQSSKDNVSAVLIEGPKFAASLGHQNRDREGAGGKSPTPWWHSKWAFLTYGLLLGVMLLYIAQAFLGLNGRNIAPPAHVAQTFVVSAQGTDFKTITAALQQAKAGDTVEVAPGEYREQIQLREAVSLVSQRIHEAVLKLAEGPTPATLISAEGIRRGRIVGFKIQGDPRAALNTGIALKDSSIDIERNEITGTLGAAIELSGQSRGTVLANYIHDNAGSGIVIKDPAAPVLENNIITGNGKQRNDPRPGLECLTKASLAILGNVIAENGAEAIWQTGPADLNVLQRNFFIIGGKLSTKPKIRVIGERQP